jgi:hypothetical protein
MHVNGAIRRKSKLYCLMASRQFVPMQISYALGSGKMDDDENRMHTSLFISANATSKEAAPTLRNKIPDCANTAVSARMELGTKTKTQTCIRHCTSIESWIKRGGSRSCPYNGIMHAPATRAGIWRANASCVSATVVEIAAGTCTCGRWQVNQEFEVHMGDENYDIGKNSTGTGTTIIGNCYLLKQMN